jgi:type IV secretory pathway TrbD component
MAGEHEEIVEAPPVGEQIHMPAPSILPILNAAGLATAIVGITISVLMIVVGLALFAVTTIMWIRSARREFEELPLEHHH